MPVGTRQGRSSPATATARVPVTLGRSANVAKDDCPHEWKRDESDCVRWGAMLRSAK